MYIASTSLIWNLWMHVVVIWQNGDIYVCEEIAMPL